VGLIELSTPRGSARTVIAFAPIATESRILLNDPSGTARRPLDGAVTAQRVLDTPLAPLYAYQFSSEPRASA
jgi:hypothetical protein